MRARIVVGLLIVIVVGVAGTANGSGFFTDDDDSIHLRSIEAIAAEGITRGCNPPTNTLYCPTATVTREQMASFLVRALDLPAGTATFADTGDSIHAADIAALADAGITKGCNPPFNDRYCPTAKVTREQMAAFLVRALGYTDDGGGDLFVDDDESIFQADIDRLGTAGVTRGCNPPTNDRFCPKNPVTREQMASFLTRALHLDTAPRIVVTPDRDLAGVALLTPEVETVAQLTSLFGTPTANEPGKCPYFLPDSNMRYVRWGSLVAVIKTTDPVSGQIGLVGWRYALDASGNAEPGGPPPEHIELPLGLELLDPISDAESAGGGAIETTPYPWTVVVFDYFTVEASGESVDPSAPIDGVQQGIGFDCE